jgi:hypothetical protein
MSAQLASCDYKAATKRRNAVAASPFQRPLTGAVTMAKTIITPSLPRRTKMCRSSRGPSLPGEGLLEESLLENVETGAMRVNFELRTLTAES